MLIAGVSVHCAASFFSYSNCFKPGSYTPFLLIGLHQHTSAMALLSAVWTVAIGGAVFSGYSSCNVIELSNWSFWILLCCSIACSDLNNPITNNIELVLFLTLGCSVFLIWPGILMCTLFKFDFYSTPNRSFADASSGCIDPASGRRSRVCNWHPLLHNGRANPDIPRCLALFCLNGSVGALAGCLFFHSSP